MATHAAHTYAAAQMTEAASKFLNSLSPDQRAKATCHYAHGERVLWYFPPLNRNGLTLRDMDTKQRELAFGIMASGLSAEAYRRAKLIIEHESVLGPLEKEEGHVTWNRDPELYYFTIFGEPGGKDPWGWRAEGHHISFNYSIWGDKVISTTPFFFGANPAEVRKGPKQGLRILGTREDLAYELMGSLDRAQRSKAIIFEKAPLDILTYNSTRVSLPFDEGLPASRLSGTQKEILMALLTEYVSQVRSDIAQEKLDAIKEQGLDHLYLAWGGPTEKGQAHYYRIHGGTFLAEFDNRQNGANHIHSVLRDQENDFAQDVMRDHLFMYHIL